MANEISFMTISNHAMYFSDGPHLDFMEVIATNM